MNSFLSYINAILAKPDLIDTFNIYATYIISVIAVLALLKYIIHQIRLHAVRKHKHGPQVSGTRDGIPEGSESSAPETATVDGVRTDAAERSERDSLRYEMTHPLLHREKGWTHTPAYGFLVFLVLAAGGFLRFWNLAGLPDGLQQDEASIGYEAYSLLHYGVDRNGYHFPVYPITWGSGGGSPLMIYLNVLTTAIFGSNVFSLRILPAFLGTLTLLVFYCFLKKAFGNGTALAGLVVLTLTPWHIILSRWSLDANTMPFWQILAAMVFLVAASKSVQPFVGEKEAFNATGKQTKQYLLSAFLFGLCLYSYGSANFIIPVTLLVMAIWAVRHQVLSGKQLAGSVVIFLLTVSPLAYFYGVNYLGLPEVSTRYISFPRFTSSHFGSVFLPLNSALPQALANNALELLQTLTFGRAGEVSWNAMPGYWVLYVFTWPVTLLGLLFGGARSDTARDAHRLAKNARNENRSSSRQSSAEAGGSVTTHHSSDRFSQASYSYASAGVYDSSTVSAYINEWKYRPDRAVDTMDIANALMRTYFIVALLFALCIQQDINREVLLFLPLVYWNVAGLRWIWRLPARVKQSKKASAPAAASGKAPAPAASASTAVPTGDAASAKQDAPAKDATNETVIQSDGVNHQDDNPAAGRKDAPESSSDSGIHYEPLTISTTQAEKTDSDNKAGAEMPSDLPDGITILDADELVASIVREDAPHEHKLLPKVKTGFRFGRLLAVVAFLVFLAGGALFLRDYYGGTYNRYCAENFMPGYGDAMVYADGLSQQIDERLASDSAESADSAEPAKSTVYSTYQHVASPFMLTLYYTKYNPFKFINSVVWKDPDAEFRVASSFGHFVFGLPVADETDLSSLTALTDDAYRNDVFVLTTEEAAVFDDAAYDKVIYKDRFVVVSRKQ